MLLLACLLTLLLADGAQAQRMPADEPLLNWSLWQRYRAQVPHPATTIKPADLRRAQENLKRYDWARQYRDSLEKMVGPWVEKITPAFLKQMIPSTTPGDTLFTPCPACRDLGKPYHPHGQWKWSPEDSEHLTCAVCNTVFPNDRYPESITLHARCGGGQTFTYYGGKPFEIFSFATGRPSFSGNIRARKVLFMSDLCHRLAEAYALTGTIRYAWAARRILLRFAEVFPNWLVHVGYGEYADMDPHIAALNLDALPGDELTPPPTAPDRRLHTGYWSAGRATGVGMEGTFVNQMVQAYDLTCEAKANGRPIYTRAQRLKIEKDLLLESTVLLVADKEVNNKSVGNATAVALVGMALGHPGMVRFGLDVFMKTIDGWFLPDGGTSESWSYALMTLSGIQALGQAFRGYSDPPGYTDPDGRRLESLDLFRHPAYQRIWEAMLNGLQGDLNYPPLADGHKADGIGTFYAEMMAASYPENPQYRALLKALAGDGLQKGDPPYAIYNREPGTENKPTPPLALPDYLFPSLQIGYLRSGSTGRDSALILSASAWGGHHHQDSLNLYFWQGGHELLSDLGYLWDHPMRHMTVRTFAHNTVMVDGKDQITRERGGQFTLFATSPTLKVMEAESRAYPQATLYHRTVAQIEYAPGQLYVADIFRVQGGNTHDYVFHGPNNDMRIEGSALQPQQVGGVDLKNVRTFGPKSPRKATWKIEDAMSFTALWPSEEGETSLIGDGWGQRDYRNSDVGAILPYIVRRCPAGAHPTVFVSVFEGFAPDKAFAQNIRRLPVPESESDNAVALAVETSRGVDYIVSCLEARPLRLDTPEGPLEINGRFAALRTEDGKVTDAFLAEGNMLKWKGKEVKTEKR